MKAEEDFRSSSSSPTGARVFKRAKRRASAMRMLNAEDNQMPLRFLAYGWGAVGDSKDRVEARPGFSHAEAGFERVLPHADRRAPFRVWAW